MNGDEILAHLQTHLTKSYTSLEIWWSDYTLHGEVTREFRVRTRHESVYLDGVGSTLATAFEHLFKLMQEGEENAQFPPFLRTHIRTKVNAQLKEKFIEELKDWKLTDFRGNPATDMKHLCRINASKIKHFKHEFGLSEYI